MKEIYLDNAATTKPFQEVVEAVSQTMLQTFGNPSSLHKKGIEAENLIKESSVFFAKTLGVTADEMIYTSGGTESNNLAILGCAYAYHRIGKKIITTTIEHASVDEVFTYLEGQGYEVVRIEVDQQGYINKEQLRDAIDAETILVSIMHVNNEIGTIQPIQEIGELIKRKNPDTFFHVDAVQAFGKLPIQVRKAKIDYLSISAHKFYGPKGIGILYKNKQARLINLLHGGGQQKNMRSGTENVPGVVGMHKAATILCDKMSEQSAQLMALKCYLYEQVTQKIEGVSLNGPILEEGAPHIINLYFKDVRAEVLLHTLERFNIYVSSGSACSSNKVTTNGTLQALQKEGLNQDGAIRFSFNLDNTKEEIDEVVKVLQAQLPILRKFVAGGKRR